MFPGGWEWLVVLAIVLLIFGAGKLPSVMGDVAKGIKKFKSGMAEDPDADKKTIDAKESADGGVSAKTERAEAENKRN
ncbi:MAG: twin-arginine translocase TatA/TatE family subunit [Alphaproteobacteria bacterium]|nr:twin-arginine translocase TatA/TatE family subunit [Alphaproteobacteria bacterium]